MPLSMQTAEASTPAPTYGMPSVSRCPCRTPSSPNGPCRTGNTTDIRRQTCTEVAEHRRRVSCRAGRPGRAASRQCPHCEFRLASIHSLSWVRPITLTANRHGSRCPTIRHAETHDTSCSADGPPYRIANSGSGIDRGYTIGRERDACDSPFLNSRPRSAGNRSDPMSRRRGGIDTRTLLPGQLYVPIVAEHDGHDFIGAPWPPARRPT